MTPARLLLPLGLAAVALAGCSSSSSDAAATTTTVEAASSTTAAATTVASTTTGDAVTTTEAGAPGTAVPTYEDAKRAYLAQADDATKASCAGGQEDKDLIVSSGSYTKLICGGIARFEYIEGADNYEKNWPTISSAEVYRAILQVPGELIVVPVGSNDDFAPALAEGCGCGTVVQQQG